jgi:hypothetical protein
MLVVTSTLDYLPLLSTDQFLNLQLDCARVNSTCHMHFKRTASEEVRGFVARTSDGPPRMQALDELLHLFNSCLSALGIQSCNCSRMDAQANSWNCNLSDGFTNLQDKSSSNASNWAVQSSSSSSSSGHRKHKPQSSFQATGQENVRVMLEGCHGGSISLFKMLSMNEQVHEASLQELLQLQSDKEAAAFAAAASEPAWDEDFPALTRSYALRVRQRLLWCGSFLHQPAPAKAKVRRLQTSSSIKLRQLCCTQLKLLV